jgi:hypothetical protein
VRWLEPLAARLREDPRWVAAATVLTLTTLAVVLFAWPGRDYLDPGLPLLAPDVLPNRAVPASVLAAPLRLPLGLLVDMLEASVPNAHGDLSRRHEVEEDGRTDIAFHLERGPFRATFERDVATVRTTIRYAMRAFYNPPILPEISGSCGTDDRATRPRLDVAISAPVAVDRAWTLRTDARVVRIAPASDGPRDRCKVTFLNLDVTDRVVDAARSFLDEHVDDIDSLAAEVDIRSRFREWWGTLQKPIQLTDSVWLAMRPEGVRRGSIRGVGDSLDIGLALQARPLVTYGGRPPPLARPLPPLDTGHVDEGLDLRVEARVEYDAAGNFLTEELGGREFDHDGRRFRLDSLKVFGIGARRLAVELLLSGDVSARLFLVGTPTIDTLTARISVPDLDFDVATRDVVLAAVSWLRADELRDLLRERASWPAAPAVEWATQWIVRGLNRDLSDNLRVEGEVDEVRILSAHALKDVLLVRVGVGGTARLFITRKARL